MAEINQLFDAGAAGCEALGGVVVQTGDDVERSRQAVEQAEERVHALAGEAESRVATVADALDHADRRLQEHHDAVVAMVEQLHGHRDATAQKLHGLLTTAQERIPQLQQRKAELLESLHASAEQTKSAVAELSDHVQDFQAHAEQMHDTARHAVDGFKSSVGEARERVAHHRQQLGDHLTHYHQQLQQHQDALVQQVATLQQSTEEPVASLSAAIDAHTDAAVDTMGNVYAQQVVGQLGNSVQNLVGAFGALSEVAGGQSSGVGQALDAIAGPVGDIGKILKDIEPIVDLIRRLL